MKTKYYVDSISGELRGRVGKIEEGVYQVDFSSWYSGRYARPWTFTNEKATLTKLAWVLEQGKGEYKEAVDD